MPKPERLEDLGRVREKLEILFDESLALDNADLHDEAFMEKYKDEKKLDELRRSLRGLYSKLCECVVILRGHDD